MSRQHAEENLRFYLWSQLSSTDSDSHLEGYSPLVKQDHDQALSLITPSTATASGQCAPTAAGDPESRVSVWSPSVPDFSFYRPKREREVRSLFSGLPDETARNLLWSIIADIDSNSTLDTKCVDALVLPRRASFYCPGTFAATAKERCLKRPGGWSSVRNVREHIWIDHLGRRLGCVWPGCAKDFGREQEQQKHLKTIHQGIVDKFTCEICHIEFPKKSNCDRHFQSLHKYSKPLQSDALLIAPGTRV